MIQVDVTIMGQPYKLACKEDEEAALRKAAAFVDRKMCAIRDADDENRTKLQHSRCM